MIFTYMAVKKKKEKLTIKSSETKILFGTILFVGGIAVLISPFIKDQATLFAKVSFQKQEIHINKTSYWTTFLLSLYIHTLNFLAKPRTVL
jgi:hypothetical protein